MLNVAFLYREETEIIEGEVVEIQIDRPATGSVGCLVAIQTALIQLAVVHGHSLQQDGYVSC